jgi:predicted pyridoxine 5'-phosphate oxidase superfamily flavin-nucleotide-binding protein
MTRLPFFLIATAAAALTIPAQAQDRGREDELARLLQGRVAGEPVRCVNQRLARTTRIVNGTAFVYRIGNVLYVNRPRVGAETLDRRYALVTRRNSSLLCAGDPVQSTDLYSGITKLVIPDDFIPYRRR